MENITAAQLLDYIQIISKEIWILVNFARFFCFLNRYLDLFLTSCNSPKKKKEFGEFKLLEANYIRKKEKKKTFNSSSAYDAADLQGKGHIVNTCVRSLGQHYLSSGRTHRAEERGRRETPVHTGWNSRWIQKVLAAKSQVLMEIKCRLCCLWSLGHDVWTVTAFKPLVNTSSSSCGHFSNEGHILKKYWILLKGKKWLKCLKHIHI